MKMNKIDFYKEYRKLDDLSIQELKRQLELRGGDYMFPDGDMPIVTVSPNGYAYDFVVSSVGINDKGIITLVGHAVEGEDCELHIDDVEGSHIHYIWEFMDSIDE